jgi:hypothetical protein
MLTFVNQSGGTDRNTEEAIARGARALIKQHGADALAIALSRSARWEAARSPTASETWRQIAAAIRRHDKAPATSDN